ncbi:AAC(3) family N-acetyltransferase [Halobacillus yeomjeoni]|uniref:aminoglycoside N(3)-acetyltransferase n=1 Tax=Halobacillus yeomjeoni TaxID=311194 RepID=UPI001CD41C3B|nr:AAC(3) family N-acetyltransferase [Halobacillus yeomjeoni]MCA0984926.1 AAC(3) family N-acetyltransferase [Halobacillus yeomjeoni]
MSEKKVIEQSTKPNTINSLTRDLQKLGIRRGDNLLVHVSMKALGWTVGGPQAVLQSLMDAVTTEGTLIIQTHSLTLSDPSEWENPPVPKEWHDTIRQTMPAFDRDKTPSTYLGVLPELFRKFPEVYRSYHPTFSISAWGKHAGEITKDHQLEYSLGENSPLQKAYDLDAKILLIGVGYDTNTSFHLSEYKADVRKEYVRGAPIQKDGREIWMTYKDIEFNEDSFETIGRDFEADHSVIFGKVGLAESRLFSMKESVDFAARWLNKE